MGVLDAGSNTVHLAVVDGHRGSPPLPVIAVKQRLRLTQHTDGDGVVDEDGISALTACVDRARLEAGRYGVDELFAFATAAIRDAVNGPDILRSVRRETGIMLNTLAGEEEARLTFIAARRWFGWSAGPLLLFDIGGGSSEVAWGRGEEPSFAVSMPLGAGRLTRAFLEDDPPTASAVAQLAAHVREHAGALPDRLRWELGTSRPVATSRTFQQLARLCGASPSRLGIFASRHLRAHDLKRWIPKLAGMTVVKRAQLPGISRTRASQSLAGAIVAYQLMRALDVDGVDVCPWALREGVMLHRLDGRGAGWPLSTPPGQMQTLADGHGGADESTVGGDQRQEVGHLSGV